jgi:pentatricopeptide repeat protein
MISLYGKVGDFDKADGLLVMMKENGIERSAAIQLADEMSYEGSIDSFRDI